METDAQTNQSRELIDLGFKPTPRKTSRSKYSVLSLIMVLIIIVAGSSFYFLFKQKPTGKIKTPTKLATASAVVKTDYCKNQNEFDNSKQGYKVCLPQTWQEKDLKISKLIAGFSPANWPDRTTPKIIIAISDKPEDVSLQDAQNNSSKFAFGKQSVGKVKGTQITYTRIASDPLAATYPEVIETYVTNFGRTYTLTLNSNGTNFNSDKSLYNSFLDNFEFSTNTANPPWSVSDNILVDSPWPGDGVASPVEIMGEAIAFEGIVSIRIKDSTGHTLVDTTIQTQSGNERSPFDSKITFNNPATSKGTLEVFTVSAKDGTEQDKVTVPITFQQQ